MVVLMVGDVVGQSGCDYLREKLPMLKARYQVDVTVANGENSSDGNGMTAKSLRHMQDSGVDVITSGNHALRRKEAYDQLEKKAGVLRPANYHPTAPGAGVFLYDDPRNRLCVINLQGLVYLNPNENPFDCIDRLLDDIDTPCILVDFHAEATAEKICMGYYLDGRVSAVIGTHTHVPTADGMILPGGTGYLTDVGMCGGFHSVLGVKAEMAIMKMRTNLPGRFEVDPLDVRISAVALEIDNKTGKCLNIESVVFL
ncbi:MAG: TIGR00282 family metallophosphoesterase [Oscillospiraceae bacterium]|nr:TIGR00282 family metallophosphoesterase [Oscillospiraceae bacterium]